MEKPIAWLVAWFWLRKNKTDRSRKDSTRPGGKFSKSQTRAALEKIQLMSVEIIPISYFEIF